MLVCYDILQYIAAYYIIKYNISQCSPEDYTVYDNTLCKNLFEYIKEFWNILEYTIEYYTVLKHVIVYDNITVYYGVLW